VVGAGLAGVGVFAADAPSGRGTGQTADQKVDPKKNRVYPQWEIHDMKRPVPPVIAPPEPSTQEKPGTPPSDAVVLFDGRDLSHWTAGRGQPAPWKLEDGAMVADKAGIETKEPIGDCQLHVEWATPKEVKGESQGRGNSGVLLMGGRYEIQVLDSYDNRTYADGQAGAVYGQNPPMVNPARPPGQWQTYDILWRGPRWDKDGKLARPARVTILYNGVYVQDCYHLSGPTGHHVQPEYSKHAEKLPLQLQFHGNPTRFRNIWYRPLPPEGVASMAEVEGGAEKAGQK
jgi:hypothetical protein